MNFIKKQQGFSLLEVLIAFTIIMVSAVSLISLHRFYMRSEINAAMLNGAMQLAETKLDDLRTFDSIVTSGSVAAYENIDTNKGGVIVSGAYSLDGYSYDLTWDVSDSDLSGFTIPDDITIYPSKNVTVNVGWADSDNNARSISLNGIISSIVGVDSEQITNSSIASGITPQVNYTPGDAPDVISVSLGDQLKQETTKPFPKVENAKGSSGVQVNFQNITYNNNNNTQVMVDTSTVSCDCKFSGGGISKNTTIPAQPVSLNNLLYWSTQREVKSTWGVYADTLLDPSKYSVNATQSQTSVCDACCENHFKGSGSTLESYYNPLNYNNTGKYTESLSSPVTSGSYIDSCRVMRLDGYYSRLLTDTLYDDAGNLTSVINYHYGQLLPDWNLIKLNVISYDFLSKAKNQESYVKYVKYVIGKYIKFQKDNKSSLSGAASNLSSTAIQDSKSGYYIKTFQEWLQAGNAVIGGDTSVDVYSDDLDSPQLIARGIFVDLLPQLWLDSITLTTDENSLVSDLELSKVSFSDVNLTLLVKWSPTTSNIAYVSNDPIKDMKTTDYDSSYYGAYKRGELTMAKNSAGTQPITAKALRGNASIAIYRDSSGNEIGINPYENDAANMIASSLNVIVGTALPENKVSITGRVYCYYRTATTTTVTNGNNTTTKTDYGVDVCTSESFNQISQPIVSNYIATSNEPADCSLDEDITGTAYRKLSCIVDKGSSLTISFTKNGSPLTGSSSSYVISTDPINFSSTFTANSSDSTCLQVYDPNITSTNGLKLPNCKY